MYSEVYVEEWEGFLTMMWAIWGARNRWPMQGASSVAEEVCAYAAKICSEARGVKEKQVGSGGSGGVQEVVKSCVVPMKAG